MELSKVNQISFSDCLLHKGTLLRPVLGLDFIAGLDSNSLQWRVMPIDSITELQFETQQTRLSKPLIEQPQSIGEYLKLLDGQSVVAELKTGRLIPAAIAGVKNQLVCLVTEQTQIAIPIGALAGFRLWKIQNLDFKSVSAFFD